MSDQKKDKGGKPLPPSSSPVQKNEKAQEHADAGDKSKGKDKNPSYLWRLYGRIKKWETANKIAAWGVVINAAIFSITAGYVLLTKSALGIANKTLEETKAEFKMQNRPFVQIIVDSVRPLVFDLNKKIVVQYYMGELKDIPAKIISSQSIFVYYDTPPIFKNMQDTLKSILDTLPPNVNLYITKETPARSFATSRTPLTQDLANQLLSPDQHMYMSIGVKYQDILDSTYHFDFMEIEATVYRDQPTTARVIENAIE